MLRRFGMLFLLACCVVRAAGPSFEVHTAEPWAADLWPDTGPESLNHVGGATPLRMRAARGETESALLIVHALADLESLIISGSELGAVPAATRSQPQQATRRRAAAPVGRLAVRIVRSFRRGPRGSGLVGERYPNHYSRQEGILLPDILVTDERLLEASIADWKGRLADEPATGAAITSPISAGAFKYFLVTVTVPAETPAGDYSGTVEIRRGEQQTGVPVQVEVRPFVLEKPRNKVLAISNDFSFPAFNRPGEELFEPSLALLGGIGMNFTRTADLTSKETAAADFELLRRYGFDYVVQGRLPPDESELEKVPKDLHFYLYGVDEPQPKDPERKDWRKMAEHVRRSQRIHEMGQKVITSLPYAFALSLRNRDSVVYKEIGKLGVTGAYEPVDWANLGLGLQRIGRGMTGPDGHAPNADLWSYVATLQREFRQAEWKDDEVRLPSKNPWMETYYWPQGLMRYPFFGRLLYGFYLFTSHLDGAQAWTMYRDRGAHPFQAAGLPIASLGYPGKTTIYPTYNLEAIREGVDDLRYAQQAYRAIARLLGSGEAGARERGQRLRERFLTSLEPYRALAAGSRRLDLALAEPEKRLQETREELARIIVSAGSR